MLLSFDRYFLNQTQKVVVLLKSKSGKDPKFFFFLLNVVAFLMTTPLAILAFSYEQFSEKQKWAIASLLGVLMLFGLLNFLDHWLHNRKQNNLSPYDKDNSFKEDVMETTDSFLRAHGWILLPGCLLVGYYLPPFLGFLFVLQFVLYLLASYFAVCDISKKD